MTNTMLKLVTGIAIAIVCILGYKLWSGSQLPEFAGAVGPKLAENYDPYLKYNGGYYSNLPIQTTSTFTASGLTTFLGGFLASSTGTQVNGINYGQCVLISDATTIAASTTANIDCGSGTNGKTAISGILAGDTVTAFATTTLSTAFLGLPIVSSHASTTAGFITLQIANNTGTTFTWTNTASSSVRYIDLH